LGLVQDATAAWICYATTGSDEAAAYIHLLETHVARGHRRMGVAMVMRIPDWVLLFGDLPGRAQPKVIDAVFKMYIGENKWNSDMLPYTLRKLHEALKEAAPDGSRCFANGTAERKSSNWLMEWRNEFYSDSDKMRNRRQECATEGGEGCLPPGLHTNPIIKKLLQ